MFNSSLNKGITTLIFSVAIINSIIISRIKVDFARKIVSVAKLIGILSLLYLMLLPLGGYRVYRPLIIRHDTFSPITVSMIFLFGLTSIYLLNHFRGMSKKIFAGIIVAIMIIFTNADRIDLKGNECERQVLTTISESPDKIVHLNSPCNILAWNRITNHEDSDLNCKLLKLWRIIKEDKQYYFD